MKLTGWGRYPVIEAAVRTPDSAAEVAGALNDGPAIARGNGRAYGDSAINAANTVATTRLDRMVDFDAATGTLVAEAGVRLSDVIATFLPRGWFPTVTPGTKFVTLGGMIAADVHGKNHHRDGGMRGCVAWVDVMGADGSVTRCSRTEHAELFDWTLGGMGLTGVILRAAIRLRPVETGWLVQQTRPAQDLDTAMALFEEADAATYSVAWIDCLGTGDRLGRSLVMLGEHALTSDLTAKARADRFAMAPKAKRTIPVDFPDFALTGPTVRTFNRFYYWNGARKAGTALVDWESFFYPLDAILGWNRIYGRRGFVQFQCALPMDTARAGLTALLKAVSAAGTGSFLAVLKRLGDADGRFSFPMRGYTLALDFPVNEATMRLLDRLDRITIDHGGRFYLAKDARMRAATLHDSDPRAADFARIRRDGAWGAFRSAQSERLSL